MRFRTIAPLFAALLMSQCQSNTTPLVLPPQEQPETPLAAGEIRKMPMSREDHDYLQALLEPLAESESELALYAKDAPANAEPICRVAPAHFKVLAACPYKVYTGELTNIFHDYELRTAEGHTQSISLSNKAEHGIRVGGIAVSSPTFHHYLQTVFQTQKPAEDTAETPAENSAETATDKP